MFASKRPQGFRLEQARRIALDQVDTRQDVLLDKHGIQIYRL